MVFGGKLFDLCVERHRFPNGCLVDLEVVKHPGAVLIVPFLSGDKIVLIKQYRPVIHSYVWELPAGTLGKGEPPLGCAKRELREEIGYSAKVWKKIGLIYPAPGYTTEKIIIFRAHKLKKVETEQQDDEIISLSVFTGKEIGKLLSSREIVDAKTICALKLSGII
ncbi:MAG: hypothetical protein A2Z72_02420 [Omnitrophica bacterium RBG_13_46_9]|nr:MAG: hypothetical protein A2Z72_02420 [Omnitrophica bacterium RBG_13_46_9]